MKANCFLINSEVFSSIVNSFLHISEDLVPFCGISGTGHSWIKMPDLPFKPVKISTFLNEMSYTLNSAIKQVIVKA